MQIQKKSGLMDVALLYCRFKMGQCILKDIKFEFNDIISLYTKNYSEWWWFVDVDILYYIVFTYYW